MLLGKSVLWLKMKQLWTLRMILKKIQMMKCLISLKTIKKLKMKKKRKSKNKTLSTLKEY